MTRIDGKQVRRTLGEYPDIGLHDARIRAIEVKKAAKQGRDLIEEEKHREQEQAIDAAKQEADGPLTFGRVAEQYNARSHKAR